MSLMDGKPEGAYLIRLTGTTSHGHPWGWMGPFSKRKTIEEIEDYTTKFGCELLAIHGPMEIELNEDESETKAEREARVYGDMDSDDTELPAEIPQTEIPIQEVLL